MRNKFDRQLSHLNTELVTMGPYARRQLQIR